MQMVVSSSGTVRREKLNGRSYLVAPITSIVPGILNGSRGPLLYTAEDTGEDPCAWNGMPLVLWHPKDADGNHISARDPAVLAKYGVGNIYATNFDGKLTHDGWFDEELTLARDKEFGTDIHHRLTNGLPIEMSTGLFTEDEPAPKGSTYNGQPYDAIARKHRPDHIAILPDEKGACSNKEGCGVNVNTTSPNPKESTMSKQANNMTRAQMVAYLTTNCDCWKGQGKTLETIPDTNLKKLVRNAQMVLVVNKAAKLGLKNLTRNAEDGEGEAAGVDIAGLAEFLGITTDPSADPVGFVKELGAKLQEVSTKLGIAPEAPAVSEEVIEEEVVEEEEPMVMEETEVVETTEEKKEEPAANRRRRQSPKDWMAAAPKEVRDVVRNAVNAERKTLIEQITANIVDPRQRAAKAKALGTRPLPILRELAELTPSPKRRSAPVSNEDSWFDVDDATDYGGFGGGSVTTNQDDDDALPEPTIDFAANRAARLQRRAQ